MAQKAFLLLSWILFFCASFGRSCWRWLLMLCAFLAFVVFLFSIFWRSFRLSFLRVFCARCALFLCCCDKLPAPCAFRAFLGLFWGLFLFVLFLYIVKQYKKSKLRALSCLLFAPLLFNAAALVWCGLVRCVEVF